MDIPRSQGIGEDGARLRPGMSLSDPVGVSLYEDEVCQDRPLTPSVTTDPRPPGDTNGDRGGGEELRTLKGTELGRARQYSFTRVAKVLLGKEGDIRQQCHDSTRARRRHKESTTSEGSGSQTDIESAPKDTRAGRFSTGHNPPERDLNGEQETLLNAEREAVRQARRRTVQKARKQKLRSFAHRTETIASLIVLAWLLSGTFFFTHHNDWSYAKGYYYSTQSGLSVG